MGLDVVNKKELPILCFGGSKVNDPFEEEEIRYVLGFPKRRTVAIRVEANFNDS